MEKLDNTGLGLIKATIERVQNERSLFSGALKKLVNSSEEELDDFLKRKIEEKAVNNGILRLISGGQILKLKALDGSRRICKSKKTFKSFIDENFENWGINKKGIATPETLVQVHEMTRDGTFMDIFRSLPGVWKEKVVTQDQVIEFCESLPGWLRQNGYDTFFLVPINKNEPIDEEKPGDNLVVVYVGVVSDGLRVHVSRLGLDYVRHGGFRHRVVSPQLLVA